MLKTPVLFLIWKRPETTKKVFESIKKAQPQKLFIAADGPRSDNLDDVKLCNETRKIVSNINWKCKVQTRFRQKNLGLKKSVSDSLNWFFDCNNDGIILEDDCLPDLTFFDFASLMLKRYKDQKEVIHISGDNFLPTSYQNNNNYYFSKYPHIWGWATWSRAWRKYDVNLKNWPEFKTAGKLNKYFDDYWEKLYWYAIFDGVYKNKINTWDYQWVYSIWKSSGVAINPGVNLVSNIGFGKEASHTTKEVAGLSRLKTSSISNSLKKVTFEVNSDFDKFTSKNIFKINPVQSLLRKFYYSILNT